MNKLSSADVLEIINLAPSLLRNLNEKVASLQDKLAFYEKKERVEKLANEMQDKNLNPDLTYTEKVDSLMQRDDLDVIEQAVQMSPKQVSFGLLDKQAGNSTDALSSFLEGIAD